jgi:hypothetical protein
MRFLFNLFKAKPAQVGETRKWKGGTFQKQTGGVWNRVVAQKHLNSALERHGFNPKELDKKTHDEMHEDVENYHKQVHLGGKSKEQFWKDWEGKYGEKPTSTTKSVTHLTHELVLKDHGVPSPSVRTKMKNKAEEEGEEAPKFEVAKKPASQAKTFKVQPKFDVSSKKVDRLPDTATHKNRFVVEGDSGRDHVVSQHAESGRWICGCEAHKYHGGSCKHLDRHLDQIKEIVKNSSAPSKPSPRAAQRYEKIKARREGERSGDHDNDVEAENSRQPAKTENGTTEKIKSNHLYERAVEITQKHHKWLAAKPSERPANWNEIRFADQRVWGKLVSKIAKYTGASEDQVMNAIYNEEKASPSKKPPSNAKYVVKKPVAEEVRKALSFCFRS